LPLTFEQATHFVDGIIPSFCLGGMHAGCTSSTSHAAASHPLPTASGPAACSGSPRRASRPRSRHRPRRHARPRSESALPRSPTRMPFLCLRRTETACYCHAHGPEVPRPDNARPSGLQPSVA